jgi:hypothetical protein
MNTPEHGFKKEFIIYHAPRGISIIPLTWNIAEFMGRGAPPQFLKL